MGLSYQSDGQWRQVAAATSVFPTPGPNYGIPQQIYDRLTYASTFTNGFLFVSPRAVTRDVRIDQIGVWVQTSAAATVVRLGIYSSDDNGRPADLIVDAGTVDASTTGAKIITLSPTVRLNAGMVYPANVSQGGSPQLRAANVYGTPPIPQTSSSLFFEGTKLGMLYQTSVSGALPTTFTGTGTGTNNHALIWLRVSEVL